MASIISQALINAKSLETGHLLSSLGDRAASGGIVAFAAQLIKISLLLFTMATMTRLLSPEDFGLIAMAGTVTGFVGLFTDLGLSAATVQRKEIDQRTVSTLFICNLVSGAVVMIAAVLSAPVAAWAFGDKRVVGLVVALACTIPLSAAAAQHNALLQRGMRWKAIQVTSITAQACGALTAILLAWTTSFGYWALVAQAWVATAVSLALVWFYCPWRPTLEATWSLAGGPLSFGLHLTGFNLVNYFHRQFDNALIGWRWGPIELGYYSRAYGLLLLPLTLVNGPITSAVLPALSRLQGDLPRWRTAFLDALGVLVLTSSALGVALIVGARPAVIIIYGDQWADSVAIFRYLAVSIFAAAPMNAMGWMYISLGQTRRMLFWSLIIVPVYIVSFILGLSYGPRFVAMSYSCAVCLAALPCIAFAAHSAPVRISEILEMIVYPTVLALLSAGLGTALIYLASPLHGLRWELLIAATATGIYGFGAWVIVSYRPAYASIRGRGRSYLARFMHKWGGEI